MKSKFNNSPYASDAFGNNLRDEALKFQLDHEVAKEVKIKLNGNRYTFTLYSADGNVVGEDYFESDGKLISVELVPEKNFVTQEKQTPGLRFHFENGQEIFCDFTHLHDKLVHRGEEDDYYEDEHIYGTKYFNGDQYFNDTIKVNKEETNVADILTANIKDGHIDSLEANKLKAANGQIRDLRVHEETVTTDNIDHANIRLADIDTANVLHANIEELKIKDLDVETANITNANIEKAGIAEAEVVSAKIDAEAVRLSNINIENVAELNVSDIARINTTEIGAASIGTEAVDNLAVNINANIKEASIEKVAIDNETVTNAAIDDAKIRNEEVGNSTILVANINTINAGTAHIAGNTVIDGSTTINNGLGVTGGADIKALGEHESIKLTGPVAITGDTVANGNFTAIGPSGAYGPTGAKIDLNGNDITLDGKVIIKANDNNEGISVTGNIEATSEVHLNGNAVVHSIDNSGPTSVILAELDLFKEDATKATFNSKIDINGQTNIVGNTSISGNVSIIADKDQQLVDITGPVHIDATGNNDYVNIEADEVNIVGPIGATGNVAIYGNVGVTGTIDVTDNTHLKSNLIVDQNTAIGGTLSVTGATTLANTLTVDDNKATTLGGTLLVKQKATLKNNLEVDGNTDINGNVHVTGTTTLDNNLIVNADTNIAGNVHVTGTIENTGNIKTNSDLYVEGQRASTGDEYALKIDEDGKVLSENFANTTANPTSTTAGIFNYVDNITTNKAGKIITNTSKTVTVTEGSIQGQFKLNDYAVDVNNLGTDDTPEFVSVILDRNPSTNKEATPKKYVDDADLELQRQIDAIESRADVVDVVECYDRGASQKSDIVHYDTSSGKISDQDIVKVLVDEAHEDRVSYYRYVLTSSAVNHFDYIGSVAAYYTRAETDAIIDSLDFGPTGADGSYIKYVSQADGKVHAEPNAFDQVVNNQSTHNNAPTSKAVWEAFNALDFGPTGADGKYIKIIQQTDGKVSADIAAFDTSIPTSNPSEATAPTTKAARDAINDLDVSDLVANPTLGPTGGNDKTLATLYEEDGKIKATFQDISIASSQIKDKTDLYGPTGTTVVTGKSIKAALDTLNFGPTGAAGDYIQIVQQTNGLVSASTGHFDTTIPTTSAQPTLLNDNAPTTKAVRDYVEANAGSIRHIFINNTELIPDPNNDKRVTLNVDNAPTDNSTNFVTSGGVKTYVDNEAGTIRDIKVNGTSLPITNKSVDITVPIVIDMR